MRRLWEWKKKRDRERERERVYKIVDDLDNRVDHDIIICKSLY